VRVAVRRLRGVCVLGAFGVMAIFSKFRLQPETIYRAEFANVTRVAAGQLGEDRRGGGGEVKSISITRKAIAVVEFSTDDSVVLTRGSKAAIHWADRLAAVIWRWSRAPATSGGSTRARRFRSTTPSPRLIWTPCWVVSGRYSAPGSQPSQRIIGSADRGLPG